MIKKVIIVSIILLLFISSCKKDDSVYKKPAYKEDPYGPLPSMCTFQPKISCVDTLVNSNKVTIIVANGFEYLHSSLQILFC